MALLGCCGTGMAAGVGCCSLGCWSHLGSGSVLCSTSLPGYPGDVDQLTSVRWGWAVVSGLLYCNSRSHSPTLLHRVFRHVVSLLSPSRSPLKTRPS